MQSEEMVWTVKNQFRSSLIALLKINKASVRKVLKTNETHANPYTKKQNCCVGQTDKESCDGNNSYIACCQKAVNTAI